MLIFPPRSRAFHPKNLMRSVHIAGRAFEVSGITVDSRAVKPGDIFVALRGEHVDSHTFVNDALGRGAAVVIVEDEHHTDPRVVRVSNTRQTLATVAAQYFGEAHRSLQLVAVTGTNGKTTTTQMIASIFEAAGKPCGIIGTTGARFGDHHWDLLHTTPFPHELHAIFSEMQSAGALAVAMEVSSHALALERVFGLRFACAAFTNLTRDHLDFHKTMDAYAAAKRSLFDQADSAVLSIDDAYGMRWAQELRSRIPVLTYGLEREADFVPRNLELQECGASFVLNGEQMAVALPGRFNVANALAAIGAAVSCGIDITTSSRGIAAVRAVDGRMEYIPGGDLRIIVDYAHTPDALDSALRALRETTRGKLTVVFGCGGDRDRGKRSQMGAIAARVADATYLTSDNPRSEDPMRILADIEHGVGSATHTVIPDRALAITGAIIDAGPGDTILIAGKGHERYQILADGKIDFDDRLVAREALRARTTRV